MMNVMDVSCFRVEYTYLENVVTTDVTKNKLKIKITVKQKHKPHQDVIVDVMIPSETMIRHLVNLSKPNGFNKNVIDAIDIQVQEYKLRLLEL